MRQLYVLLTKALVLADCMFDGRGCLHTLETLRVSSHTNQTQTSRERACRELPAGRRLRYRPKEGAFHAPLMSRAGQWSAQVSAADEGL